MKTAIPVLQNRGGIRFISICLIENTIMKKFVLNALCLAVSVALVSCSNGGKVKERPDEIEATGPRLEIFQNIMAEFPDHKSVKAAKPQLFDGTAAKEIILTNESEVYVTFISEGASYPNTFGWYSYSSGAKPTSPNSLEKHVLFPHVTERVLRQGDRLQIGEGKFPAGTVIGFFLIINGWDSGTINYDRETFYTNIEFNPNSEQQHVLFKDAQLGDLVLAFEDILTSTDSDQDYNDIIFTVTDNKDEKAITNFNMTNVIEL